MEKSPMTSSVTLITPELAKDILKTNLSNRKIKRANVDYLRDLMLNGKWKENGESFIIDTDGHLKDGQHRLEACVKANHSFYGVITKGVRPDVMDTIDTGINRTLADVLYLNGFKSTQQIAASVKGCIRFNQSARINGISSGKITNAVGLIYATQNRDRLNQYYQLASNAYSKSGKVMNVTFLTTALHIITKGKSPVDKHKEFISHLCGNTVIEQTATSWFFRTMRTAQVDKTRFNEYWKYGIVILCWNKFISGNPNALYVKFLVTKPLPTIL